MSTIAFIGLGIMGGPMARHLVRAGHAVIGFDRSEKRMKALVEAGGAAADSIEETVKGADVVAVEMQKVEDEEHQPGRVADIRRAWITNSRRWTTKMT